MMMKIMIIKVIIEKKNLIIMKNILHIVIIMILIQKKKIMMIILKIILIKKGDGDDAYDYISGCSFVNEDDYIDRLYVHDFRCFNEKYENYDITDYSRFSGIRHASCDI